MTTLNALAIYPVKSCQGISLQEARITPWGLAHDREWMVVNENGYFCTQREFPQMAQIKITLNDNLQLDAPNMPSLRLALTEGNEPCEVTIWQDTLPALDVGEVAAQWLSEFLHAKVKLVRFQTGVQRSPAAQWLAGHSAFNQFSDGFPFLICNQASLDDLNQRLSLKNIPVMEMVRFRPNLVLEGLAAFEEDYLEQIDIFDAAEQMIASFRLLKPCPRCPIPTLDPKTGQRNSQWSEEPIATLSQFHTSSLLEGATTFGVNAIATLGEGQLLKLGQRVEVHYKFD